MLSRVRELHVEDPITIACLAAGSFTLSSGTMQPAIVLERLLIALSVLGPSAHRRLLAPDGLLASVPASALRDESSSWWDTHDAGLLLQSVIGAINAAAPAGYACCWAELDRIELARIDAQETDRHPFVAALSNPPPVSAVQARPH
jgi:hypothetical protein